MALPCDVQEDISKENSDRVEQYMDSVSEIQFKLREQEVKVKILDFSLKEKEDLVELIYEYQLA